MIAPRALTIFSLFAQVADLVEVTGDAGSYFRINSDLFDCLHENVNQRNVITLVHTVTGLTALRSLLPYLTPVTTQTALRDAWQSPAALYSISGCGSLMR